MLLAEQVAVVTGSSRGIGKAIALALAGAGAAVVVNGLHAERVAAVVAAIQAEGGKATGICADVVSMSGGVQIIGTAIETFGRIDILVNNAGVIRDKLAHRLSEEDWDLVLATHLKGCFACTQPAIIAMQAAGRGGSIINMTSSAGLHGTIGQLNYSAAKAGILGMTWTLAQELARNQISVNAISPAALTDMTRPYVERAQAVAAQKGEALPDYWQIGAPEAVAELVLALVAPASRRISGKIFSVNGGHIGIWAPPQQHMLAERSDNHWNAAELLTTVLPPLLD